MQTCLKILLFLGFHCFADMPVVSHSENDDYSLCLGLQKRTYAVEVYAQLPPLMHFGVTFFVG